MPDLGEFSQQSKWIREESRERGRTFHCRGIILACGIHHSEILFQELHKFNACINSFTRIKWEACDFNSEMSKYAHKSRSCRNVCIIDEISISSLNYENTRNFYRRCKIKLSPGGPKFSFKFVSSKNLLCYISNKKSDRKLPTEIPKANGFIIFRGWNPILSLNFIENLDHEKWYTFNFSAGKKILSGQQISLLELAQQIRWQG